VQRPGHVRRGDDDAEGRLVAARVGPEQTRGYPLLVQSLLYLGRRVLRGQGCALLRVGAVGLTVSGGLQGFGHVASLRPPANAITLASAS
jgi:hypothetical protein